MSTGYRQFCPVAKAMELLDERWTLLVVRELFAGSERFNDVRRGVPRMSPTLLSRRLQQLIRAGIVERQTVGTDVRYLLTPAGRELGPVVEAIGAWGTRWVGELGDPDLDPKLLLWDVRRNVNHDLVPNERTVIHFCFDGVEPRMREWWLVIDRGDADVCDQDPGHPVTVDVEGSLRTLVDIWLGNQQWGPAIRAGHLTVIGPAAMRRALPSWFALSRFAAVPRPRAGR